MELAQKKAIQRLDTPFLPMPAARAVEPATVPASAPAGSYAALLHKADHALATGDYLTAERSFREAIGLAPRDLAAYEGLALTLSVADRYPEAADAYEQVADLAFELRKALPASSTAAPDLVKVQRIAFHNQAVAFCRTGELAKAEEVYQMLADEDPSAIQYRFNLAAVRQARGHASEALSAWKSVTADAEKLPRPDAAFAWWAQGQMQMELGQVDEAVDSYARVTNLTPEDPQAWQALAVAARCSGSLGRALVAIKRAVALSPKDDSVQEYLGDLYLDLHRQSQKTEHLDLALQAWRRSLEINGRQPLLEKKVQEYEKVLQEATGKRQPATGS